MTVFGKCAELILRRLALRFPIEDILAATYNDHCQKQRGLPVHTIISDGQSDPSKAPERERGKERVMLIYSYAL